MFLQDVSLRAPDLLPPFQEGLGLVLSPDPLSPFSGLASSIIDACVRVWLLTKYHVVVA